MRSSSAGLSSGTAPVWRVSHRPSGVLNALAVALLRGYKRFVSPILPRACRFSPTCSEYATLCFVHQPFWKALAKTVWRLLRCQPFARGGIDLP